MNERESIPASDFVLVNSVWFVFVYCLKIVLHGISH